LLVGLVERGRQDSPGRRALNIAVRWLRPKILAEEEEEEISGE